MLLTKLILENYGVYDGRHVLDLTCDENKPVILCGGKNGSGKTTILEAIMLSLYGKTFLGKSITKKQYKEFLSDKIHTYGKNRQKFSSVQINFVFHHNRKKIHYEIKREWESDGNEILTVKKNDDVQTNIDHGQWSQFIGGVIPLDIAKLFFLDGDAVVRMINWEDGTGTMQTSIESLVGIELMERMKSDLRLYIMRKSGTSTKSKSEHKNYKTRILEKKQLTDAIQSLKTELENKKNSKIMLMEKIDLIENQIEKFGGNYVKKRIVQKQERINVQNEIKKIENNIIEKFSLESPFYLISSLTNNVLKQLNKDNESLKNNLIKKSHTDQINLLKNANKEDLWDNVTISKDNKNKFMNRIYKILDNVHTEQKLPVLNLSYFDAQEILSIIKTSDIGLKELKEMLAQYKKMDVRIQQLEESIIRAPADDEIGPILSKSKKLHEEKGRLDSEISHIEQKLSSKDIQMKILKNRIKKSIESYSKTDQNNLGVQMAVKLQKILDEYINRVKERKILLLEQYLIDSIKHLMHKNMLSHVHIDRKTYQIKLFDKKNIVKKSKRLSEGEKQIIGTALLWAVAKTSGRILPFVIDTPLSRLDGDHRFNLIERFYPHASHQMIILSTDKEIDKTEYVKLRPSIKKSYHIVHNDDDLSSSIKNGYFWRST